MDTAGSDPPGPRADGPDPQGDGGANLQSCIVYLPQWTTVYCRSAASVPVAPEIVDTKGLRVVPDLMVGPADPIGRRRRQAVARLRPGSTVDPAASSKRFLPRRGELLTAGSNLATP